MEDIELEVSNLNYPRAQGDAFNLILKAKNRDRFVPVLIGLNEAKSIIMEVNHIKMKRPFAHDVMLQLCQRLNCSIQKVLIDDFHEGIFYVHIFVHTGSDVVTLDARVSDAVVIALKSDTPIFMTEAVFNRASYEINRLTDQGIISDELAKMYEHFAESDDDEDDFDDEEDVLEDHLSELDAVTEDLRLLSSEILQKMLDDALAQENYELAAEIDAEINRRNSNGK